jgi:hypothetical protein
MGISNDGRTDSCAVFGRLVADLSITIRRIPSCGSDDNLWVSSIVENENARVWVEGLGGESSVLFLPVAALAFAGVSEIWEFDHMLCPSTDVLFCWCGDS